MIGNAGTRGAAIRDFLKFHSQASDEEKDSFYQQLEELTGRISQQEPILVLGDFIARVGSNAEMWPRILGRHGIGYMNDNGQSILELCAS
ncbi:hypothetical protein Y1Q_0018903 [Alligator mississippiensis]|uniref:Uncharacterized protein n=1 Tax=Alligator mississippiensis TaxID=8496 RepID=A0A151M320_ALLMI|nr:hypothetical protein Y1Q_0018903 [Alligator mississippiensis]